MRARVYKSAKREFDCKILESGKMCVATCKGNLLKNGQVVVGDYVQIEKTNEDEYVILSVEPRESEIFRLLVRENKKKVTASNIDRLVILNSVSKPAFKRGIVDRFLVRASQWGVKPIVVFNKMDQYDQSEFDILFEAARLRDLGAECFEICAKQPDTYEPQYLEKSFKEFKESLAGKTAVFLGQSGVGKSKTISALSGGEVDLKTQQVGKVGKGSHTTTWSEIVELENFSLIDSPGIRSFSLDDIDPEELLSCFPDLEEISIHCKFNNCSHEEHVKGCAFFHNDWEEAKKERVLSRLESFQRIKEEISQTPFWAKKL